MEDLGVKIALNVNPRITSLIVAIEKYEEGQDLFGPAKFGIRFANFLVERVGVDPQSIKLVISAIDRSKPDVEHFCRKYATEAHPATFSNLIRVIEELWEMPGDELVIFWGGHGFIRSGEIGNRALFLPERRQSFNLDAFINYLHRNSACAADSPKTVTVLVDACAVFYKQATVSDGFRFPSISLNLDPGRTVKAIFSAGAGQAAHNSDDGLFSSILLKYLQHTGTWPEFSDLQKHCVEKFQTYDTQIDQSPAVLIVADSHGNERPAYTRTTPTLTTLQSKTVARLGGDRQLYPLALRYCVTNKLLSGTLEKRTGPASISLHQYFVDLKGDRCLAVLGLPGAGKTNLVKELGRQLIRERHSSTPVLINLSNFESRISFRDWVAGELSREYNELHYVVNGWLADRHLCLILDRFDALDLPRRNACITSINQFLKELSGTEIVFCTRLQEYLESSGRLAFSGAVCVVALSESQIFGLLEDRRKRLEVALTQVENIVVDLEMFQVKAFCESIREEPTPYPVAPLSKANLQTQGTNRDVELRLRDELTRQIEGLKMLEAALQEPTVMRLATCPASLDALITIFTSKRDIRLPDVQIAGPRVVWDVYLDSLLSEQQLARPYTAPNVRRWLVWIARRTSNLGVRDITVDVLQPNLLRGNKNSHWSLLYYAIVWLVVAGIVKLIIPLESKTDSIFFWCISVAVFFSSRLILIPNPLELEKVLSYLLMPLSVMKIFLRKVVNRVGWERIDTTKRENRTLFELFFRRNRNRIVIAVVLMLVATTAFSLYIEKSHNSPVVDTSIFVVVLFCSVTGIVAIILSLLFGISDSIFGILPLISALNTFSTTVIYSLINGLFWRSNTVEPSMRQRFAVTLMNMTLWSLVVLELPIVSPLKSYIFITVVLYTGLLALIQITVIVLLIPFAGGPWDWFTFLSKCAQVRLLLKRGEAYHFIHREFQDALVLSEEDSHV
jgi:hypothetical protein